MEAADRTVADPAEEEDSTAVRAEGVRLVAAEDLAAGRLAEGEPSAAELAEWVQSVQWAVFLGGASVGIGTRHLADEALTARGEPPEDTLPLLTDAGIPLAADGQRKEHDQVLGPGVLWAEVPQRSRTVDGIRLALEMGALRRWAAECRVSGRRLAGLA